MQFGFLGLLALLFVALKLTNVIAWSWFWVLAPIWVIPVLIVITVIGGSAYILTRKR